MNLDDLYRSVGPSVEGPMPLIIVTEGWLEACETVTRVRETIVHQADLTTIAEFDTDQLLDQRARRPLLSVTDGVTGCVEWPKLELAVGSDSNDRPFLLLHGPEPDFRWRPFGRAVAALASAVGVTTTYTISAYPAPMPHTRPLRVSSTASDAETLIGKEHTTGALTVPVGVFVAITQELERYGSPTHGLWAQLPFYLSNSPWPHGAIAMLKALDEYAGLAFDTNQLAAQIDDAENLVKGLFDESPSLHDVVRRLEERYDALRKLDNLDLPSGDELEEQLQQYLRKIDGDPAAEQESGQ